jgi:hypothetical protein
MMRITHDNAHQQKWVDSSGKVYTFAGKYKNLDGSISHIAHVASVVQKEDGPEIVYEQHTINDLDDISTGTSFVGTPILVPIVVPDMPLKPLCPTAGEVWRRWDGRFVSIEDTKVGDDAELDRIVEFKYLDTNDVRSLPLSHFMECLANTSIPLFTFHADGYEMTMGDITFINPYNVSSPVVGEAYLHFKEKMYTVLHIAPDTETGIPMIVYKQNETGEVFVRSEPMFSQRIKVGAQPFDRSSTPRFTYMPTKAAE